MNIEEKEQWLYEEYQYTKNFDFNRLDKYEEANDDICIDDLILDYTMLYEFHKGEIERLNNIIKEVREYIEEWQRFPHTNGSTHKELKNLIDILDKEKDNE